MIPSSSAEPSLSLKSSSHPSCSSSSMSTSKSSSTLSRSLRVKPPSSEGLRMITRLSSSSSSLVGCRWRCCCCCWWWCWRLLLTNLTLAPEDSRLWFFLLDGSNLSSSSLWWWWWLALDGDEELERVGFSGAAGIFNTNSSWPISNRAAAADVDSFWKTKNSVSKHYILKLHCI